MFLMCVYRYSVVVDIVSAAEPCRDERRMGYQGPQPGDLF